MQNVSASDFRDTREAHARPARHFVETLHGLRGVMALWIVLHHITPRGYGPINFPLWGYMAVDVFFILSGYVLALNLVGRSDFPTTNEFCQFIKMRFWRTYPLYITVQALTLLALLVAGVGTPPFVQVVGAALLLEGWACEGIGVNGAVWSLGVEWIGYFLIPFLPFFLGRLNRPALYAAIIIINVGFIAYCAGFTGVRETDPIGWHLRQGLPSVVRMLAGVSLGCVVAFATRRRLETMPLLSDTVALVGVAGIVAVIHSNRLILALPFLFLLVVGAAGSGPLARRLLANRLAKFAGRISFALYLVHMPIELSYRSLMPSTQGGLNRLLAAAAVLAISVCAATLLCMAVEERFRYGHRRGTRVVGSRSLPVRVN